MPSADLPPGPYTLDRKVAQALTYNGVWTSLHSDMELSTKAKGSLGVATATKQERMEEATNACIQVNRISF